jgi:acylphosphatase
VIARQWLVSGQVQGVGFRHHTKLAARRLDLVGWVRNLPDGRVACQAQGPLERVEELEAYLRRGPELAEVTLLEGRDVPVEPEPPVGAKRFVVLLD